MLFVPTTGSYFGSHFIMGGERFDTPQPEAYLFGENTDLNFLGSRPTPVIDCPDIFYRLRKTSITKTSYISVSISSTPSKRSNQDTEESSEHQEGVTSFGSKC